MQPITVKAYGGRRYTRAKRLVLRRNQKTRGRFYLFLLYEVNQGRVHWAFYPGKGAKYVCRFLRRVRRWYPRQVVRIGLDRDPATSHQGADDAADDAAIAVALDEHAQRESGR